MIAARVFPTLLIRKRGLYKGIRFKDHKYVGDPINAVRIFNDKEVDEIAVIDIEGSRSGVPIDPEFVRQFAAECFIPLTVGGGVSNIDQAKALLQAGAEKILINSAAITRPALVGELASVFGSSSVVVGIDYKRSLFGKPVVVSHCGSRSTNLDPLEWAIEAAELGAGEIVMTSIDRDGTGEGYDTRMLARVTAAVSVPVAASGGLGALEHIEDVVRSARVSAVTGGSFFVFHGARRAVLISFPKRADLESLLQTN